MADDNKGQPSSSSPPPPPPAPVDPKMTVMIPDHCFSDDYLGGSNKRKGK